MYPSIVVYKLTYDQMTKLIEYLNENNLNFGFPRGRYTDISVDNDFDFRAMVHTMLIKNEVEKYMCQAVYKELEVMMDYITDSSSSLYSQYRDCIQTLLDKYQNKYNTINEDDEDDDHDTDDSMSS